MDIFLLSAAFHVYMHVGSACGVHAFSKDVTFKMRSSSKKKEEIVKKKAVEHRLLRLRLVTLCPGESVTTFFYIVLTCVFHYICEV